MAIVRGAFLQRSLGARVQGHDSFDEDAYETKTERAKRTNV